MQYTPRSEASSRDTRRRRAFGRALAEALDVRRMTQLELGDALGGLAQSTVSSWKSGDAVPDIDTTFRIEKVLKLPPGNLSQHLGYLPVKGEQGPTPVDEAIAASPMLSEEARRVLLAVYREMTSPPPGKPGRKPRRGDV